MLVIAGTATVTIQDWDEAIQQIQHMMRASEAEDGCRSYQIYVDPADRNRFFIFEEWENEAALHRHFQLPHMGVFSQFLAKINAQLHVKRYEVSSVALL